MAKDKERTLNPATQQRKLEKAKALKKGKAEAQIRRNEKLARKNPERLQRQISDLKSLEENGQIKLREKQMLEELERELRGVIKAREALGEKAPSFGRSRHDQRDGSGVLGKRKWDGERKPYDKNGDNVSSGEETDESVRRIPMPKDTPPPIPREYRQNRYPPQNEAKDPNAPPSRPTAVPFESKTTYESAPQIRNLQKEATSRFVPTVVRRKIESTKGQGGLLEPEELDRLEKAGYGGAGGTSTQTLPHEQQQQQPQLQAPSSLVTRAQTDIEAYSAAEVAEIEAEEEARRLAEEEERFRSEMSRQAHVEDAGDDEE